MPHDHHCRHNPRPSESRRAPNSINNVFTHSGQQTTLTSVGAGFNYAVTDNLRVGVEVSAVHQHGGFGPALVPQPGALP